MKDQRDGRGEADERNHGEDGQKPEVLGARCIIGDGFLDCTIDQGAMERMKASPAGTPVVFRLLLQTDEEDVSNGPDVISRA
jgi:hypothetical protein